MRPHPFQGKPLSEASHSQPFTAALTACLAARRRGSESLPSPDAFGGAPGTQDSSGVAGSPCSSQMPRQLNTGSVPSYPSPSPPASPSHPSRASSPLLPPPHPTLQTQLGTDSTEVHRNTRPEPRNLRSLSSADHYCYYY